MADTLTLRVSEIPDWWGGRGLFVSGINHELDEAELRHLFEKYGVVETCVLMKGTHLGSSHARGFVTMERKEEATAARVSLDGATRNGFKLGVWSSCNSLLASEVKTPSSQPPSEPTEVLAQQPHREEQQSKPDQDIRKEVLVQWPKEKDKWSESPPKTISSDTATNLKDSYAALKDQVRQLEFKHRREIEALQERCACLERLVETCMDQRSPFHDSARGSSDRFREKGINDGWDRGRPSNYRAFGQNGVSQYPVVSRVDRSQERHHGGLRPSLTLRGGVSRFGC